MQRFQAIRRVRSLENIGRRSDLNFNLEKDRSDASKKFDENPTSREEQAERSIQLKQSCI